LSFDERYQEFFLSWKHARQNDADGISWWPNTRKSRERLLRSSHQYLYVFA